MPTFQVYKGGEKVVELVGGDPARLRAMVAQHYTKPYFSGKGQTLGNSWGLVETSYGKLIMCLLCVKLCRGLVGIACDHHNLYT